MLYRRNTSDAAIGWISMVDSLLLGFGLMVVLALHSAMTRRDVQTIADSTAKELKTEKQSLADARMRERSAQQKIEEIQAEAVAQAGSLTADLRNMIEKRDALAVQSQGLQEQLDAQAKGVGGISEKLRSVIVERDSLKANSSQVEKRLVVAIRDFEDAKLQLADATKKASEIRNERNALDVTVKTLQSDLQAMRNRQEQSEKDDEALAKEVEKLRKQLAGKSGEIDDLTLRLDAKRRDIGKLEADAAKASNERRIAEGRIKTEANAKGQFAATDVLGFKGRFENVVFIVDISRSMTWVKAPSRQDYVDAKYQPERWNKTKKEIVSWSTHLPMKSLRLVLFHSEIWDYPDDGGFYDMNSEARGDSVALIEDLLSRVKPEGQTNTLGAFSKAYSYPQIDTIVLFTDGHPEVPGQDSGVLRSKVLSLVKDNRHIPVNVVGIGEYFDRSFADFLRGIAGETGGEFIGR